MCFMRSDINTGAAECRNTPGAVLVDVREPDEFKSGHIPGAANLPLSQIGKAGFDRDTPLFVCCLRGTRSIRAVSELRRMGYTKVRSIGGITRYRGPVER